tara:strand:+ start:104 stop:346 length:243 start_codon:yes stop_codon:yes gene_type:complete
MKAETKALITEYKMHQDWEERCKSNLINMNDYFKYSGKTEEDTEEWKEHKEAQKYANIKATIRRKCRRKYFKEYWLNNKI